MNFLQGIYKLLMFAIILAGFIACHSPEKKHSLKHVDLDKYKNRNFFGIVDSGYAQAYPYIRFDRNHYKFYTLIHNEFIINNTDINKCFNIHLI